MIEAPFSPVLQVKVVAVPLAVIVPVLPVQITGLVADTIGRELTVKLVVVLLMQLCASMAVTVKSVEEREPE